MDKDFSAIIDEIVPFVSDGDRSLPFIIARNNDGSWDVHYPQPAESAVGLLEKLRERDPYAVSFTGADFAKGSFPSVYDKVLCARLYAEFECNQYSDQTEMQESRAMYNFFEVNIGEFSQKETDYLATIKRPLAALSEMCPYKMTTDNPDWYFNEDLALEAVRYIENDINARLRRILPPSELKPGLRMVDGYLFSEKQHVDIGRISVILSESTDSPSPFLVCNKEGGEDYHHSAFPDYLSAMREFTARQSELVKALEMTRESRRRNGVDSTALKAESCLPDSDNMDFKGKTVIVKANELSPEYRYADSQLLVCTHGSGARPGRNGGTVFGTELYTGEIVCYGRFQIEGVADETKLPQWARDKLALREALKEPGVFEYGGYHFKPVRQFMDGETVRPLTGDSRPWKNDAQYAMRNMASDFSLGISAYDWKKTDAAYSIDSFYEASGGNTADIFRCIENGKLYVPGENELFLYSEPPQMEASAPDRDKPPKPQSLLDELNDAKAEAATLNAAPKDKPSAKKRGDKEL
ncbi:MAG: hypothetical protein LBR76_03020 [Oscillospiraceae bacterium]|jgi:hypothetical protein|nr:hypothetical protein [Oscillospiraceae bacterium]